MARRLLMPVVALACALATTTSAAAARDRDNDKLPDRWERRHQLSTSKPSGAGDPDHDRLSNRREHRHRTNPRRADTDRDGLRDRAEIRRHKTNPRRRDTDRDGYSDGLEVRSGSDPRKRRSVPPAGSGPAPAPAPGDSGAVTPPRTVGAPATPPTPPRCDRNATTGSLGQQLGAATAGQEICLASGDYGNFAGARKPGMVRIREQPGATASMGLRLGDAANIEIDGLTITGGTISGGTRDVVVRNSFFTSALTISGLANANVLLDHNTHADIDADGSPARLHLSYRSATPSGVTIQSSLLTGGDSDGIQTGVGLNIVGNEFRNILADGPNHTDAIQLLGADGTVIRGNYIHDSATGIVAYDGLARAVIEDNVVDLDGQPWGIELYSDDSSVVRHNTLLYRGSCWYNLPCGQIDINRKSADDAGRGTVVVDNIATQISVQGGSAIADRHHNLLRRSAQNGESTGTPAFTGGTIPTSLAGYTLAAGSPGRRAASDGSDIGMRP